VLIATPDHWHALPAIHACEAGKDVYCEKPLSLTIAEGQDMVRAARRYRRVFQVGTQQRSDRRFRRACELVRNGAIGRVVRVKAVLGRGPSAARVPDGAPPEHLDWGAWLGPAPVVPYNQQRCHYNFRWFFDYSGGKFTDWGAHHLDIVQWGLGTELSGPLEVEARGTFPGDNAYETPVDFDAWFQYPDGITLHVTGAGENGVTFHGTEGEIFVSRGRIRSDPGEILEGDDADLPLRLYRSDDHHQNWVSCLRTRQRPVSDVELGHRSATVCHLANIAMKLGRRLRWDPVREHFPGDEVANRFVSKPKRHPWSL
jgi:predicted dehydrogenase